MKATKILMWAFLVFATLPVDAQEKVYVAYKLVKEPVLDGDVQNDPAWKNIPLGSGFTLPGTQISADSKTIFKMGYTEKSIFAAIICEEIAPPPPLKPELKKNSSPWSYNSVEVFLYPPENSKYYQFMVNELGQQENLLCTGYYLKVPPEVWRSKVQRHKNGWSAELEIPYGIFKEQPFPAPFKGQIWKGNFCRNNFNTDGDRATCWAFLKSGRFHEPEFFGKILFAGEFSETERINSECEVCDKFYAKELNDNLKFLEKGKQEIESETDKGCFLSELDGISINLNALKLNAREKEKLSPDEFIQLIIRSRLLLKDISELQRKIIIKKSFTENKKDFSIYMVKPMSSPDTWILPDSKHFQGYLDDNIQMMACPGEYESASFVIRPTKDISNLEFTVSELKGTKGTIPASNLDLKVVKCWYQGGSAGIAHAHSDRKILVPELLLNDDSLVKIDEKEKHNYVKLSFPDGEKYKCISNTDVTSRSAIIIKTEDLPIKDADKLQPLHIKAETNKQFWITIHTPENARAGLYNGKITMKINGQTQSEINIDLKVLPFKLLPPYYTSSIYYGGRLTPDDKGTISGMIKSKLQYRKEMEDLKAHGISDLMFSPLFPGERGSKVYDESVLKPELDIRAELGMLKGRALYLGGFIWQALNMKQPKLVTEIDLNPEVKAHLQDMVRKIIELAKSYGMTDVYFYGLDEAKGKRLTCQREAWEAIREAGGKIFVAGYAGDNFKAMGDIQDLLVCAGWPFRKEAEKWHSKGHKIWCYGNPQGGLENAEINRRNFGLLLWKNKYDGAATWIYMGTGGNTWNDFDNPRGRDYNFAYPTVNGIIGTIQWEGYREGVDDVRYVTTLEDTIKKVKTSGSDEKKKIAVDAQKFLDAIDVQEGDLDLIRTQIIDYLLRMK